MDRLPGLTSHCPISMLIRREILTTCLPGEAPGTWLIWGQQANIGFELDWYLDGITAPKIITQKSVIHLLSHQC